MILTMFIIVKLIIFFCSFKISLGLRNTELIQLRDLEDFLCAFSLNDNKGNHFVKYDPWYCVAEYKCSNTDKKPWIKTIFTCNDIPDADEKVCCHILNIKGGPREDGAPAFKDVEPAKVGVGAYALQFLNRETLKNFYQVEYTESVKPRVHQTLGGNAICALTPAGVNSLDEPLYTPYICWHLDCHLSTPRAFKEDSNWQKANPWAYSLSGERFCSDYIYNRFCCHASVALKSGDIDTDLSAEAWKIRLLSQNQKYAVGFRSSFQCEQYSRLVCHKNNDLCPLRVLDQDTAAVPTTYSFQALLGIQLPRMREFVCGGAVVSRLFILSASACQQYEGVPVSIALIGEYDTTELHERGVHKYPEIMTYLSEVYDENYDDLGGYPVALFRLWRPLTLTQYIKPACLDWKANFRSPIRPRGKYEEELFTGYRQPFFNDTITNEEGETVPLREYVPQGFVLPKELIFSGFGSTTTHRGLNRTLKRIPLVFRYEAEKPVLVEECRDAYQRSRTKKIPSILCNSPASVTNKVVEGPCEFDMGAPATTGERDQAPYCMRKVGGVALTVRYDCDPHNVTATLFKNTHFLTAWMEEVIWRHDFHLAAFDISTLPSCHDPEERSFRDMIHTSAVGWQVPAREPSPSDKLPPPPYVPTEPPPEPITDEEAVTRIRYLIGNRLYEILEPNATIYNLAVNLVSRNDLQDDVKIHHLLDVMHNIYGDKDKTFNKCCWRDLNSWWRVYSVCLPKPRHK